VNPSAINNYMAMIGYLNYARQVTAMRQFYERTGTGTGTGNENDIQAAEILTDLSQVMPIKRERDNL
jgi:hypothetical protein